MYVIHVDNVNEALPKGVALLKGCDRIIAPRGMETIEFPTPVSTVYTNPTRRVLFNKARDANPFFHLMEALWILAGREDVEFLAQYNAQMREYSDDGKRFHAAYGQRLRNGFDQVNAAVRMFQSDPDTRQVVLQIWDANKDLNAKIYRDGEHRTPKDLPCNDLVFLKLRDGKLNMTVCCRSNDMVWGAYGANAVQFSVLLEYMAARVGVGVGTYTQISDSFHVYTNLPVWEKLKEQPYVQADMYAHGISPYPLVDNPGSFDAELKLFMVGDAPYSWDNSIFPKVAIPMQRAWKAHKDNKTGAHYARHIEAQDWRLACLGWLERRNDRTPEWGFSKITTDIYKGIE